MLTIALPVLLARGVRLQPHEAVAIGQELLGRPGAPTPDNVQLGDDGTASCVNAAGMPSVSDVAGLLEALLPPGTPQVPGPLRYAIARGRRTVEAPPFASPDDFSRTLQRFEVGERAEVIRGLVQRVSSDTHTTPAPRPVTVLRSAPAPEAMVVDPIDRALELERGPMAGAIPAPPRSRGLGLAAAVAVIASFAVGYALIELRDDPKTLSTPVPRAETAATSSSVAPGSQGAAPAPVAPSARGTEERAVPTSGRKVERVRLEAAMDGPAFSPAFDSNGTAIFFHTGGSRAPRSAIGVATSNRWPSGDLGVMTIVDDGARNYHAQPSPDGRFVAFDSDRDGERAVYVADRDGSHVRRVSGDGYAAAPTWSPDGKRLAYVRAEPGKDAVWNLWVQPVGGGEPTRLTNHPSAQTWSASWFPDNRRIAYTHEDKVIVLDLPTGKVTQFDSPVKGRAVRTPAVSPDGSAIIFQVFRRGAWLLNLSDGSMRCVLEDPTAEEFAWAPDGRRVAFHSRRDGRWGIYLLSSG